MGGFLALTAHGSARVLSETVAGVAICFQLHCDGMQVGVPGAALLNRRSESREEPEGKRKEAELGSESRDLDLILTVVELSHCSRQRHGALAALFHYSVDFFFLL